MDRQDPEQVIAHVRGLVQKKFMISHEFAAVLLQQIDLLHATIDSLCMVTPSCVLMEAAHERVQRDLPEKVQIAG